MQSSLNTVQTGKADETSRKFSIMADRNRKLYKPINRTNRFPPFSSSSSNFNKPRNPLTNPRPSYPNSNSSDTTYTKKTTSSNWENDCDDGYQDIPAIVGTCPFMCPVEERVRREKLRDLAVFERLHGNPSKTSPNLAVKKFCRTISTRDLQASDVRPISVLEESLNHALSLLHSNDHPFEVVHDFIFDRTRSIRQDLSMQNLIDNEVIHMYERMVKFHIISHHNLHRSSSTPIIASMCHLNLEQLLKALKTLLNLYEANRASNSTYKNEAEFHSYYLLLLLGSNNQGEALTLWLRSVPYLIVKSKEMRFAQRIVRYFRLGNYKRFIYCTEQEATYLQYCIIESYINEVRILALSYICYGGYKLQPYPLQHISKLLMMKESDVESLCVDCGLETSPDGSGKGLVSTKQLVTCKATGKLLKSYPLISERIERLAAELSEL